MRSRLLASALLPLAALVACSSNSVAPGNDGSTASSCPSPGGPVTGAADAHCAGTSQATDVSTCHANVDAGPAPTGADAGVSDYGPTMFGTEGDDDDCKYHVKWSSTPLCEGGTGVYFTVTATKKTDGSPLTGAYPYADVVLNDKHPAPLTNQRFAETSPGVYSIGPIRFDSPGQWTARFHFYGDCQDITDTSPHGHAAFFVDLP